MFGLVRALFVPLSGKPTLGSPRADLFRKKGADRAAILDVSRSSVWEPSTNSDIFYNDAALGRIPASLWRIFRGWMPGG
jgi:hypothetical protein